MSTTSHRAGFAGEAQRILSLPVAHRVNALGGYGADGEVIYDAHPMNCPSVLVDSRGSAKATFMSNGSVEFLVSLPEGMDVHVLDGSFDNVEKRETSVPSSNVWLSVGEGRQRRSASLINPTFHDGLEADSIRIVKLGDPDRAMWFCATFRPARGVEIVSAVRYAMTITPAGPAITRQIYLRNNGSRKQPLRLWTYCNLHGTQQFVYNKELWYDSGRPVKSGEIVVAATVPWQEFVQVKRVSSRPRGAREAQATCDYASFVGSSAASAMLPQAVREGQLLDTGAGKKLNRFTTPAIAATRYDAALARGKDLTIQQSLLYLLEPKRMQQFRRAMSSKSSAYTDMAEAFNKAAANLLERTPDASEICQRKPRTKREALQSPFAVHLPAQPAASQYANSVWTGVKELYENCRAHGAMLADGVELGTRDRAQDMWPKMKEDPARIREDLVHAFSFMYRTVASTPKPTGRKRLSLREKLHGMFPRQYPSRWLNRSQEVMNDNRPYTDSPLWLINSLAMYIRETGDVGILDETVGSIRLTDPEHPETSGIVGGEDTYRLVEVVVEIFECFARHIADSPYKLAQILYGDWCDPIDMFGTAEVGDPATRSHGRGVQVRLSGHLFQCLVEMIDLSNSTPIDKLLRKLGLRKRFDALPSMASDLRKQAVKVAWEDGPKNFLAGFLEAIHEKTRDGKAPKYSAGETGYTLGSMKGRDFDRNKRRSLVSQAYGLYMLQTQRDYLAPVDDADAMTRKLLRTVDQIFFDRKLGLKLFTVPIANSQDARDLVGRMGIVPAGCAENGEYHHGQCFMHRFRLSLADQPDKAWKQFQPIMSAMRDESLAGPFETPSTSYASDPKDPHFGEGMYFGLSGSTDWIVEIFQDIAGVELALHDPDQPAVRVTPRLPAAFEGRMTYQRLIHCHLPSGGYRVIPLQVRIDRKGDGRNCVAEHVKINGRRADNAEVDSVESLRKLNVEIVREYGD